MHSQQSSAGSSANDVAERALVLGGGGAAGNAWEIGVIAGLFDAGTDVTEADLIVGTSSGATVAAQISSARPADLLAAILGQAPQTPQSPARPVRAPGGPSPTTRAASLMETTSAVIEAAKNADDMRRRLGAAMLEMDAASGKSRQAQWRDTVAARLPGAQWPQRRQRPQRRVHIVAVDADTGEPVVFDRDSGVDVVDAVAASCANGFTYAIGENRYIDGGYRRSSENADLAAGYRRVLVLSPFGGRSRMPAAWCMHLAAQVDELRAGGSRVETVFPDGDSRDLFGANAADPSSRPRAARAGYDQGRAAAQQIGPFWH